MATLLEHLERILLGADAMPKTTEIGILKLIKKFPNRHLDLLREENQFAALHRMMGPLDAELVKKALEFFPTVDCIALLEGSLDLLRCGTGCLSLCRDIRWKTAWFGRASLVPRSVAALAQDRTGEA